MPQLPVTTPAIACRDVTFAYEHTPVLEHISCTIMSGDYVGILGPNGSGKTTLVKILLGLLTPQHGEIKIFGQDSREFQDRATIGYVPQRSAEGTKDFPASAAEVVRSGRSARVGLARRFTLADHQAVRHAMEIADVWNLRRRLIHELSGGQLQRVFIARALANEPKILLVDEPTVGVDLAAQEIFYSFIKQLNQEQGMTILFVSHDIDVITQEAKTILCINRQLVCHVSSKDFITGAALQQLYGQHGKFILHRH